MQSRRADKNLVTVPSSTQGKQVTRINADQQLEQVHTCFVSETCRCCCELPPPTKRKCTQISQLSNVRVRERAYFPTTTQHQRNQRESRNRRLGISCIRDFCRKVALYTEGLPDPR